MRLRAGLDDVDRKEEDRDRPAATPEENPIAAVEKKDPFEEIDFVMVNLLGVGQVGTSARAGF